MRDIVERRLSKDILQKAKKVIVRNFGGGAFKGGRRLYVVAEQVRNGIAESGWRGGARVSWWLVLLRGWSGAGLSSGGCRRR